MELLKDPFGRILHYIRISVTDRCNFRCQYCMPKDGVLWIDHGRILRYEDLLFLCHVLKDMGAQKIRFTGGEPLVRKDFTLFLKKVREMFPSMTLSLTTNGSLLAPLAEDLLSLNLESINISLDTLNPERFKMITCTGSLSEVIQGIQSVAGRSKTKVKLNTVLMRGINDHEIPELLAFALKEDLLLRLIEFMPLDGGVWSKERFISADDIIQSLPESELWREEASEEAINAGPARYLINEATGQRLGIIAAVSHHFCASCNRLRITSEGEVLPCLFSGKGVEIRDALRSRDEEKTRQGIIKAIRQKPRRWLDIESGKEHMFRIGG
ncbi:MAG: GTP 3',8-cyclase MoaA [Aminobacterium sp.]|jgi:cyclic pyranopterin phosphate synthase|uniref:GTP 3',8-cyclase MoaA n=1 Tax=Aminobacterium sp. MB27-C1 TaxID=3070661 RepID=UPI001BCFA996|nr:GTP 3',8-cyclase MoaA [Aminobacterium sp. MB27-C1]MDD2206980.1 GTP 3',8-cyclase MoaA [Aminobacterium sp.]MDD3425728.1 GTP 3',8-cyclase MoaA [Aminobacterium sp.]MDD3707685.1 GTP 3',8-cyclase MoaA [Aminobacterium sp.]MDD4228915.1 GTP 3',8-cyclase MoaA [Aminobacterium sp.]MDD4551857.1 GTP 3',8-cyclase MoaA [Aminobacterium sp.]